MPDDVQRELLSIEEAAELARGFVGLRRIALPLCAAENITSEAVRVPLESGLDDRYIMGGVASHDPESNFIGSERLHGYYTAIGTLCRELYGAQYADPRPHSALSAVTTVLMTLTEPGMRIMVSTPGSGGHPSMPEVCRRLGLEVSDAPYDLEGVNFDFHRLSRAARQRGVDAILLAPSDVLQQPAWDGLDVDPETLVIYDATQSLGLLATTLETVSLACHPRFVLLGGTHKTLPGPPKGLVMTNAPSLAERIDKTISPSFIRNTHMSHVASLHVCLLEHRLYGQQYQERCVQNANSLAAILESSHGFDVVRLRCGAASKTHQIFVRTSEEEMARVFRNAVRCAVTLNKKRKELFGGSGIRLGVQEVTRYGWGDDELAIAARVLSELRAARPGLRGIRSDLESLASRRSVAYAFGPRATDNLRAAFGSGQSTPGMAARAVGAD